MTHLRFALGLTLLATVACTASSEEAADVSLDERALAQSGTITSVNSDGTWTATANAPTPMCPDVEASATFTGPSGKTRKMGVCLLKKQGGTCTTAASCPAPPTGGSNYCVAGSCYQRIGSQAEYCGGSPGMGGTPVGPGTYIAWPAIAYEDRQGQWISYACFEGCSATDPSTSSTTLLLNKYNCQ